MSKASGALGAPVKVISQDCSVRGDVDLLSFAANRIFNSPNIAYDW